MSRGRIATSTRAGIAKPRPDETIRSMTVMVGEMDSGRKATIYATEMPSADKKKTQKRIHIRRVSSVNVSARSVHDGRSAASWSLLFLSSSSYARSMNSRRSSASSRRTRSSKLCVLMSSLIPLVIRVACQHPFNHSVEEQIELFPDPLVGNLS